MFSIPSSDKDLRCIVNLNGYALDYDPNRWIDVPLTTDLAVLRTRWKDPQKQYQDVLDLYKRRAPNVLVGSYISGGRIGQESRYPNNTLLENQVEPQWLRSRPNKSDRIWFDSSIRSARKNISKIIVEEFKKRDRPILFLDNIIHPLSMHGWTSWKHTCKFVKRIRRGVNRDGKLLITNNALAPWYLNAEDAGRLSSAVDGMSFEMPFHRIARGDRAKTEHQNLIYRWWLDQGKTVIMIPVTSDKDHEKEKKLIAAYIMLLRNPGDKIFIAWAFWGRESLYAHWPEEFGNPIEELQFEDRHILTRKFEKGILRVNTLTKKVEIPLL